MTNLQRWPRAHEALTAMDAATARQTAIREAERAVVEAVKDWWRMSGMYAGDKEACAIGDALDNLEALERGT